MTAGTLSQVDGEILPFMDLCALLLDELRL
jgi:hypothetical protein